MATDLGLSLWGSSGQAPSVYTLGLLEPKMPERDGSVLCVRSGTFRRQMRAEDEGHLTAAPLEKAFRQLISGSSALAGGGNSRWCLLCSLGAPQAVVVMVRDTHLCWYVCQVVGDLGHLPFSAPSFWRGAGKWRRYAGLQADLLILCQVRQGCFWLFFQHGTEFPAWQASSPGQDGLAAVQRTPGELMINVIVCNSDRGPLEPGCHTQLISPAVLSPFVCSPVIRLPVN